MRKTAPILLVLFAANLCANTEISNNIIQSASNGREVVSEKKLEAQDINKSKDRLFHKETILNWHFVLQKENPRGTEVLGKTSENLFVKNLKVDETAKEKEQEKATQSVNVKGFCLVDKEINAGVQPSSMRVECNTNVGFVTLFANLVNVNEKYSLLADPKYIEKNKVRFAVKSAIVLNEEKTSYNLATFVNDRKIEAVGWNALSYSSEQLKTSTNEYLKALIECKKKQEIQYAAVNAGGVTYAQPVQTTNVAPPRVIDYFATAGVNILADIIKSTAEVFKKDLPYLYQIAPRSKIWIDLEVESEGVRGQ